MKTEQPDGTVARVVFDSWHQGSWDPNDCVEDSDWLLERQALPPGNPRRRAADLTLDHAGTPTVTHLDSLGRPFLSIEDNGGAGSYETRIELDAQGNEAAYLIFDKLGRRIHQESCDAGSSWDLTDDCLVDPTGHAGAQPVGPGGHVTPQHYPPPPAWKSPGAHAATGSAYTGSNSTPSASSCTNCGYCSGTLTIYCRGGRSPRLSRSVLALADRRWNPENPT